MKRKRLTVLCLGLNVGLWAVACGDGRADKGPEPQLRASENLAQQVSVGLSERESEGISAPTLRPANRPLEAMEVFLAQRLGPDQQHYPINRLQQVRAELIAREKKLAAKAASPGGLSEWHGLGPGNIGGRTRAFVIDPTDPMTLYAGGVSGGVWKSTDGGASWRSLDDLMLNLAVTVIVLDPADPHTLYAGTGEGLFGYNQHVSLVRGLGIFKSSDAGATWRQLEGTVSGVPDGAFHFVNDLVISPHQPNRMFAATPFGVWRSQDAGETWSVVLSNPRHLSQQPATARTLVGCTQLAIRTDVEPEVLFAASGNFVSDGLYRSSDGGDTWEVVLTQPTQGRIGVAVAASNNDIMYACLAKHDNDNEWGRLVNIYRSSDGGTTWQPRVDFATTFGPWLLSSLAASSTCYGQGGYDLGWYTNLIAVDPADPDIVWVGGVGLFRSSDGARTFGIAAYPFFGRGSSVDETQYVHVDEHNIVFDPAYNGTTNQTMYVGCDGGIFRTDNARSMVSQEACPFPGEQALPALQWQSLNHGYAVTQFYHGDSATGSDLFVGGTQDNGVCLVDSRTTPENWVGVVEGDGTFAAVDPRNADVVYFGVGTFPGIYKSSNGGVTFAAANNGITDTTGWFPTPFTICPSDPDVLWTGSTRPWRSTNGAAWWTVAGDTIPPRDADITAIAVAPGDPDVVYYGTRGGSIVVTGDGMSANPSWTPGSDDLPAGWVSSIAVDPRRPEIAYCTYSTFGVGHIFRTTDGGGTWSLITGIQQAGVPDIPVHSIALSPCDPAVLWVGTELGVFVSEDTGATWHPANSGLAHVVVEVLDFSDADTLVAFTYGRGAFLTELAPCPARIRHPAGRRAPANGNHGS